MSAAPKWLQGVARTVRNSPRLTSATETVFGRLQGNRTVVDVATRVFGFDLAVPIVFLRAGRALAGMAEVERLPVVLVNAAGMPGDRLTGLLEDLEALQRRTRGFRPVLLLDTPAFAEVRAYDWPMELVVPAADWSFATDWDDYLADRVAMMVARYRAWIVVSARTGTMEADGCRILGRLEHYRPWEARKV